MIMSLITLCYGKHECKSLAAKKENPDIPAVCKYLDVTNNRLMIAVDRAAGGRHIDLN